MLLARGGGVIGHMGEASLRPATRATSQVCSEAACWSFATTPLCPLPSRPQQPYLGVGQMSEGLAGLQGLHELHDGGDTALGQQHAAQAAEAAEGLLQLSRQGACRDVLDQDHGLASLGRRLQAGNQDTWGQQKGGSPG